MPAPIPLILVAGARPNFMKIAPLLRALRAHADAFRPILVHTGQHYDRDMSAVFFEQLGIPPPDISLEAGSGTHGEQTARVLERFERFLMGLNDTRSCVVVVGDVNSTMACALAATKLHLPVAHVEAGLRSFDRSMPEEVNRVVTDAIADLLLVSEPSGEENLRREGVAEERMRFVGNVMIDTLVHELPAATVLNMPARFGLRAGEFAVVTLHRPSNVDDETMLTSLVGFFEDVSRQLAIVWPRHPRAKKQLDRCGLTDRLTRAVRIITTDPLSYRELVGLLAHARVAITDSGGIQEETSYLGVPCITLRPSTERPVTVTLGTNTVAGSDLGYARDLVSQAIAGQYKKGSNIPGWDGRASERIAAALRASWASAPAPVELRNS